MLTYLHVKNIALIDELEVDFGEGFNILTGETGAGKSIIIGSIDAVLGQKVSKDFIRKDAEFALIELVFHLESTALIEEFKKMGVELEDEILISRRINLNGRSVFKLNGEVVTSAEIKAATALLIDLHSQHEHQSLLEKKNHIHLLDRFLGDKVHESLLQLKNLYKGYLALKGEAKDFTLDENLRRREIDFLEYEVSELEGANLVVGEDDELEAIYKKQSNMHQIQNLLAGISEAVYDSNYSASEQVSRALEQMNHAKRLDPDLDSLTEQLIQIDDLIRDYHRDVERYMAQLVVDEELLEQTRSRIDLINTIKMKHGNTISDVLTVLQEKKDKLDALIHFEDRLKQINKELSQLEQDMSLLSESITKIRSEGAKDLAHQITAALGDLNLKNTRFEIQLLKKTVFTAEGMDEVEFLISTNIGEALKPLIQIASGGELSRVMLAIKSVLADCDDIGTLIFDEIDTGISGRTAQMVAEKMVKLSRTRQIICITHLPQIAAMGDNHYLIEKNDLEDRTVTTMQMLSNETIHHELARLLGGAKITDAVMNSAIEMKNLANELKK